MGFLNNNGMGSDSDTSGRLIELESRLKQLKNDIDAISVRLSSLGFFAFKQKAELSAQLNLLKAQEAECKFKINSLKNGLNRRTAPAPAASVTPAVSAAPIHIPVKPAPPAPAPLHIVPSKDSAVFEVCDKVAGYLSYAGVSAENGFETARNVMPDTLNGAEYLKRYDKHHRAEQWQASTGVPFDLNTYGKPVSFLISRYGKPVLAIVVMRHSGQKFSQPHTQWIEFWCRHNMVPMMRLNADMTNSAGYVIAKVCRLLGLNVPAGSHDNTMDNISRYLSEAPLLKSGGYEIQRDVTPGMLNGQYYLAMYDADRSMDRWQESTGIPFDLKTYGKPISFLISQYGRPVLAIVVFDHRGQKFSQPHTKWIEYWCMNNAAGNVSIIKLYADMPNDKAYVLDRVYEALGRR